MDNMVYLVACEIDIGQDQHVFATSELAWDWAREQFAMDWAKKMLKQYTGIEGDFDSAKEQSLVYVCKRIFHSK